MKKNCMTLKFYGNTGIHERLYCLKGMQCFCLNKTKTYLKKHTITLQTSNS